MSDQAPSDWATLATWLRQRANESDRQWVERLDGLFAEVARERAAPRVDDAKSVRMMDRAWRRYLASLKGASASQTDDI